MTQKPISGWITGRSKFPKLTEAEDRERSKRSLLKGASERTARKIKSGEVKVTLPYVKG